MSSSRATARTLVVAAAALGRVGLGLAFVATPQLIGSLWVGSDAHRPGSAALARALGVRDALLGVGALYALWQGATPAPWLAMGAMADASDAAITGWHYRALPPIRRAAILGVASTSALAYAALARGARNDTRTHEPTSK